MVGVAVKIFEGFFGHLVVTYALLEIKRIVDD
jgi:hypothetical protein